MKPDVAIVTGAARGIGAAVGARLAEAGWRVVGFDCAWGGSQTTGLVGRETLDVADFEAASKAVAGVEDAIGPVGILVNNAGITRDAMAHKMDPGDFRAVLDVNLIGPFHLCRAVLPAMRARSFGRIVNISSMNALRGQVGQANYAASKAGLIALTKSIALENATRHITANCIAPGFIETDMTDRMPHDLREAQVELIPVGRIGLPVDVANAVVFLVSEDTTFVTGQVISVNGGQLMP